MDGLLIAISCLLAQPSDAKAAMDTAIATIEHQSAIATTWRIEYSTAVSPGRNITARGAPASQTSSYVELRSGPFYRTRHVLTFDDGRENPKSTQDNAFDGEIYRQLDPEGNAGGLSSASGIDHSYLGYVYRTSRPLVDMLRTIRSEGRVAWSRLNGRAVLECVITEPGELVRTLSLDPANGWQPRRIQTVQKIAAGIYPDRRRGETMTFETKAFLKQDGVVVPSEVNVRLDAISESGAPTRLHERTLKVSTLVINPPVKEADFRLTFPDGTRVVDEDRQVSYVQGQPGSERLLAASGDDGPRLTFQGALWTGLLPIF